MQLASSIFACPLAHGCSQLRQQTDSQLRTPQHVGKTTAFQAFWYNGSQCVLLQHAHEACGGIWKLPTLNYPPANLQLLMTYGLKAKPTMELGTGFLHNEVPGPCGVQAIFGRGGWLLFCENFELKQAQINSG